MIICVVGGGHIGTALVCYLKHVDPGNNVRLLTRRPKRFSKRIICNDIEGGFSYAEMPNVISADPAIAAADADMVYICLPHFAVEHAFSQIAPHVAKDAFVGVIPGSGGCELYFDKYFQGKAHLFGFQRVPFTAKLAEYGKEVNLKSWKPCSVVGTMRSSDLDTACALVEACGLKTACAANFLAVSLTPSNPVLHTSRIYELFKGTSRTQLFDSRQNFYVGWTNFASETMLQMDDELHALFDSMPELDMTSVRRLTDHYEAPTVEAMTTKINSIPTFQSVLAPMIPAESDPEKYLVDTSSRMFTEDFPWGLAIIKGYCEIFDISTPKIDEVLSWYADYMELEYYIEGRFEGKDLSTTGIPQNYGIRTPEQVLELYCK